MTEPKEKVLGLLAELDNPAALLTAARNLRASGYRKFECHSPFPVHGMDEAAGERRSKVSLVVGIMAVIGLIGALYLQGWTSVVAYPLVVAGKPFFSYQAFVPITFAGAVLLGAFGALFSFMAFMNLRYHHPVFYSDRFIQFSDDRFFVSVESADRQFDISKTRELLESLGGKNVEILKGD